MKKVLFICEDNAVRSRMAEGFAKRFGKDVMEAASAGLEPAAEVNPMSVASMRERGMEIEEGKPRGLNSFRGRKFDLCVAFCPIVDEQLNGIEAGELRSWEDVSDPRGGAYADFRRVQGDIGSRVLSMIRDFRGQT